MLLELTGFIMAFVFKGQLGDVYKKDLHTVLSKALNDSNTEVLNTFAEMEKKLKCCGINDIEDYHGREPQNPDCYRYRKGCSDALIKAFNETIPTVTITLGIVLLFELFCLINALALTVALKTYDGDQITLVQGRRSEAIRMGNIQRSKYNALR